MLDNILPLVKKPIRYTDGEYNATHKSNPVVNVGIVFPEVYEIGMSNLGIKIIYHLFNQVEGLQCERIFAPWPDFGERLRNNEIPLYGLESKKPISHFDLLGFSLQSELCYTTVLYVLELGQIPYRSSLRDARYPILVAGGPVVFNPTPLSSVFDAFVIGDGEGAVESIAQTLMCIPKEKKHERLEEISRLENVWVPLIHRGDKTVKRSVASLDERTMPSPPLLPMCEITHDRLTIEVMRGCTWGCRFCQAGYVNRPIRTRSEEDVIKAVEKGIRQTGWEEISLLSFSILDYPNLLNLVRRVNEILRKKMINISLPTMRGELFSEELALLLKEIKKTGLTFAPETASEQLRCRLNKKFSNDKLIASIKTAHMLGWKQVKLYFMIGLPFERDSDIAEIRLLIDHILKAYPKGSIKVSVSPFIPKPHTPFESVEFAPLDELHEKIREIKMMRKRRVTIKYQSPEVAFVEAFLSKADDKIFPAIEYVYKQGGKFEEWREGFDFSRWQAAFEATGIDPKEYLRSRSTFPWNFIDTGVTRSFLKKEFTNAQNAVVTENCYYEHCSRCGACDGENEKHYQSEEKYMGYGRYPKRRGRPLLYRVRYSIGEAFRFASHLDIARTIYRALRRSDLPIQFTQGFSPIPKVSFCPPKSVGQIAKSDFFDFYLESEYFGDISTELNARFPSGIRILEVRAVPLKTPPLSSSINLIYYEIDISADDIKKSLDFVSNKHAYVETKSGKKKIADGVESISLRDSALTCGLHFGAKMINVYELLSYLTDRSVESAKTYKIARTKMCINRDGVVYSPMEVK